NFAAGSADLSPSAKSELRRLANDAGSLKRYVLQVKGYTDSLGTLAVNQALSMRRAPSVIAYLEQSGNIPLTHVLTPGAMGESHPMSSNETAEGRAENRRVEVKVLVSRGLAGQYRVFLWADSSPASGGYLRVSHNSPREWRQDSG